MTQPPLANSELAIMDLLWSNEPLTAREIREKLYSKASKAQHGTVQKLLQRLEVKDTSREIVANLLISSWPKYLARLMQAISWNHLHQN